MTQTVGITAYGAYLPRLRLDRASIAAAHAWAMPGLKGQGRGERSMADWDEDSITMAVEAARDCLRQAKAPGGWGALIATTAEDLNLRASLSFFGYLLAAIGLTYVLGQMIALPLFVLAYARRWGGFGWPASIAYAGLALLIVWGLYGTVMSVLLYPPMLG